MDPDLAAIIAAKPSFLDGKGLFPMAERSQFNAGTPARVIRTGYSAAPAMLEFSSDRQQDDPPPAFIPPSSGCPTSGNVTVVISGVLSCGCVLGNIATFSADGTYSVPVIGGLSGQGSWTNQGYTDSLCTIPSGSPTTGTFTISVSCDPSTFLWTVTVSDPGSGLIVFSSAAGAASGSASSNVYQCSISGDPAGGGSATVTV